jgi:sulfopyruvate decarboxylase subunit beta
MKRWEAVAALAPHVDGALVVACNGMLGRDLWASGDRSGHFYMIGSMGLASSIGLGLALARPERRVVVLDGDGNVLMGMGALANAAAAAPPNFHHVILDNGVHASTGGQRTVSAQVPLEEVARAAGYREALRAAGAAELERLAPAFFAARGPACLLVEVEPGNRKGVPRVELPPEALAARFREEALRGEGAGRRGG